MPRLALSVHQEVLESRLRTRAAESSRPMEQKTHKERAMQAAMQVMTGAMSVNSAVEIYMVEPACIKYYQKKLAFQGMVQAPSPVASTPSGASEFSGNRSELSSYSIDGLG